MDEDMEEREEEREKRIKPDRDRQNRTRTDRQPKRPGPHLDGPKSNRAVASKIQRHERRTLSLFAQFAPINCGQNHQVPRAWMAGAKVSPKYIFDLSGHRSPSWNSEPPLRCPSARGSPHVTPQTESGPRVWSALRGLSPFGL